MLNSSALRFLPGRRSDGLLCSRLDDATPLVASAGIVRTTRIWGRQTRSVRGLDYRTATLRLALKSIGEPTFSATREKGASQEHSGACYVARRWHESKPCKEQDNSAKVPVIKAHVPVRV
jgi:hypothetical protein